MSTSLAAEGYNEDNQFFYSMLAMIWFGIGEVIGCVYIGQIIDRFGSKIASLHICAIILIMGALTIVYIILNHYYTGLAYAMCFFWGVQDSTVNAHIQGLLGFEFDNTDLAYSVLNSMMALTVIVFLVIEPYVLTTVPYLIYAIIITLIAFLSIGYGYFFDYRERKSIAPKKRKLV
jgi:MFS family permease